MKKRVFAVVVAAMFLLVVFLFPGQAFAQGQGQEQKEKKESTRWGVSASFAPRWELLEQVKKPFNVSEMRIYGSDLEIGFVRGKEFSGDWGVSYIRKKLGNGSRIDNMYSNYADFASGSIYCPKDVTLEGIEVRWYKSFVTIRKLVQVGMNFAVGPTWLKGNVEEHSFLPYYVLDPVTRTFVIRQSEKVETKKAAEAFVDIGWPNKALPLPSGKAELVVAVIVAPGLKVKFSGGLNFPGYQKFSIGVTYFPLTKR